MPTSSPQQRREPSWIGGLERGPVALAAWLAFSAVTCLANLGGPGIISMEGMVADGAQAMLAGESWAVPTVYGEPYTYKPALAYWMSAGAQSMLGDTAWALRAPFALAGLGFGLAVVLLLRRRVGWRAAAFAGMAATGTALFIEKVRLAEFDTPLTAGVGVAVTASALALAGGERRGHLWWVAYAGLLFGFLAKGAPALMAFAPGLVLAALVNRRFAALFEWRHLAPLAAAVLAACAYVVWAVHDGGWQIFDQPFSEARYRGAHWTAQTALRTLSKPALVAVALLPFSLLPAIGARRLWRRDDELGSIWRSGVGFLVGGLMAFMAVPTHEMRYYLPLVAGNALASAAALEAALLRCEERRSFAALRGLALGGIALSMLVVAWNAPPQGLLLVAALALIASFVLRADRFKSSAVATAVVGLSLTVAIVQAYVLLPRRAASRDLSAQAELLDELLPESATLWVEGPADAAGKYSSLYHHLDRTVRTLRAAESAADEAWILLPLPQPGRFLTGVQPATRAALVAEGFARIEHPRGHFVLVSPWVRSLVENREPRVPRREESPSGG